MKTKRSFLFFGAVLVLVTAMAMNVAAAESVYTVTFNSQGGSAIASQSVTAGYTVPYPAEPTKAGVFFDGWYKESGCINPCDYRAPVSGPITLYAKWLTENDMIAGEFGASVPASNMFEVNNANAAAAGEPGWNTSWAKARTDINNGGTGKNYVIKVTGNFQLARVSSNTFTPGNIKVLIYAPTNKTISSSGSGDLLYAGANQTLILRNITLQGAPRSSANAHLLMRPGTVASVSVSGGTFTMSGGTSGGVSVSGGTYTMIGGTISGAVSGGGVGISGAGSTFTMSGGTISGNMSSDSSGGGVSVGSGATFTMNGGTIHGNTTYDTYSGGGGVRVGNGTFTMNGGTIYGNKASSPFQSAVPGGGVSVAGGTFMMSGGTISGNTAAYGGGVYVGSGRGGGTFTMSGGTISGNGNNFGGGGVHISSGTFTMSNGTISGNTVGGNTAHNGGGGVRVGSAGTFTMSGGSISGNTAREGGDGVDVGGGTFTMGSGTISGNDRLGVYVSSGTFWMSGGTIYGRGAGTGLAHTYASLAIKDTASIAKYGNFSDILESGLTTDETLVGHD
jgi:uncharacterized repeat protein (TIGR02543 family)